VDPCDQKGFLRTAADHAHAGRPFAVRAAARGGRLTAARWRPYLGKPTQVPVVRVGAIKNKTM